MTASDGRLHVSVQMRKGVAVEPRLLRRFIEGFSASLNLGVDVSLTPYPQPGSGAELSYQRKFRYLPA